MGQMGRHCFKSEINDSKEIVFESFKPDFQQNVLFVHLKKTATKLGISKNSNFIDNFVKNKFLILSLFSTEKTNHLLPFKV
jgi:CRISPR/Cas system CSM-associated protein Csm4 (group 5 of RAMP superfamily)